MKIVFPDNDYSLLLSIARVKMLSSWWEQLNEQFYWWNVLCKSSCLHYLLPDKLDPAITDRLRHSKTLKSLLIRTEKLHRSCLPHCLKRYDWL